MRVENRADGVRRSWLIVMVRRSIRSQLHGMIVAWVAIYVRMDLAARQTRRDHRYEQQHTGQLPDGALDPEAHAALKVSKRHASMMP